MVYSENVKRILLLLFFLGVYGLNADENRMTHYVTGDVPLREGDSLSPAITTLPKYTALRIIETGETETIDGIEAPWIKIESQSGYTGWCFSGYVRQIESDMAEDIARSIENRKAGTYPDDHYYFSKTEPVSSMDAVRLAGGYYLQQTGREFQGPGHTPEILALSVENEKVYIREIDMADGQTVTRNEILLQFNGKTYAHNRTKLATRNGEMQIIYGEHIIPDHEWRLGTWEYDKPYTFAGALDSPLPDKVCRLTTDYLKHFAGSYVFDSYKLIRSENQTIDDVELIKNTVFQIAYRQEKKCLTVPLYDLCGFYMYLTVTGGTKWLLDFVETIPAEPFWWTYGEGVGFSEARFYFYKGGIAFTYEHSGIDFTIDEHQYIKYVVFFRKE